MPKPKPKPKPEKMKQVAVRMTAAQLKIVRRAAKREKMGLSEYIRWAATVGEKP